MNQSQILSVLWLTKQGFELFVSGQKSLFSFPFLPESVKYFDVINEEKFLNQLEVFVILNKLSNLNTYFIIAPDALMEKEFVKNNDDLVNQFIETIPYELVFSKKLIKEKSVLVACFNASFYQLIDLIWKKHDSQLKAVLPYFSVGQTKFDLQTAALILKKGDSFKNQSMISNQADDEGVLLSPDNQSKNQEKSILPIVLPIFIILIIILVFFIFNTNKSQNKNKQENLLTPTTIIIPTPTNLPVTTISPAISGFPDASSSAFPLVVPTL